MTDPQFPPPVPQAPGHQPPAAPGYHAAPAPTPTYQAPPGAYSAPVGGYGAPTGAYQPSDAPQQKSSALGIVAFALSIVAAVVAPIVAGAAGYQIGFRLPTVMQQIDGSTSDLSFLAPVRDQVLMGEVSFWLGTLAGIAAIVLGIMAIVKRAGRAWGVTALILGVLGPVIFFTVLGVTLGIGAGAGSVTLYGA
ncbi:hypothetical protein AB0301_07155 [Microbacterium profundi]|uniref:DUF4064 domain-containing protein n=1 Tax=Microbacterium profundi TaxID=450380 RepID=A0ABV3LHI1_9MICO|nr:hypothetical protein [Microbacterium profundi]MCE7482234.1 DUF1373 domain-containing protein [Microbacterium profundi]